MSERERAEERVAEYLAALEAGHEGSLDDWLEDESPEFQSLAAEVYAEVGAVLGALGLETARTLEGPDTPSAATADGSDTDRVPAWHYELGDELGRGGNGQVLEVFDRSLERRLAMKVLMHEPDAIRAARRRARFRAEARLAGRLQHPGVVAVHELGRTPEGEDYFTMPKVEGETLGQLIRAGHEGDARWSRTRLLDVLVRVAETMAYAHAGHVVHRDLKPANVMVGAFGETYVLDWGLARVVDETARDGDAPSHEYVPDEDTAERRLEPGLTGRGDVVGTPAYMPPEQAGIGDRAIGVTADVYALGACLHEVLTGEPPFGRGADAFEILTRLVTDGPPDIDVERHRVPPELAAIRDRAMSVEPEARYSNADGFAQDLRAFLEGRVVAAYESGGFAELRKWVLRNRGLAAAMLATVVAIVGGVSLSVWFRTEERARSLRFLDLQLAAESFESVRTLWPVNAPEDTARVRAWLDEATQLLDRRERHQIELAALNDLADAQRERRRSVDDPRWTFDDEDSRWRHENLEELVETLDRFAAVGGPHSRVAAALERITTLWPAAREDSDEAWRALSEAWIASPTYTSPPPEPIGGLVPLGIDPRSGLAEFALVGSGEIPQGPGVEPLAEHAIVLAAVPGGVFEFGIPFGADPFLFGNEQSPISIRLEPYLLGRFELTEAQYRRLVQLPEPAARLALRPASGIAFVDAVELLAEWNLELPTAAQWENAAELAWPWSARPDATQAERLSFASAALQPLRPIGGRARDAAGFGDLLGNLAEYCRDPVFDNEEVTYRTGDGLTAAVEGGEVSTEKCHVRGGHYGLIAPELPRQTIAFARPEFRIFPGVEERADRYGIRVARALR